MLSGLIHCQHCGHNFLQKKVYAMSGDKKQTYRYYLDGGYQRVRPLRMRSPTSPPMPWRSFVVNKVRDMVLAITRVAIRRSKPSPLSSDRSATADDDAGIDRELERSANASRPRSRCWLIQTWPILMRSRSHWSI